MACVISRAVRYGAASLLVSALCNLACRDANGTPPVLRPYDAHPHVLRSTFALPADTDPFPSSTYIGRWSARDLQLVVVPRATATQSTALGMFGAVPRGSLEGVLSLVHFNRTRWQGHHVSAVTLQRRSATLTHVTSADHLEPQVEGHAALRLRRAGRADVSLLQRISIVCRLAERNAGATTMATRGCLDRRDHARHRHRRRASALGAVDQLPA